MIRLLIYTNLYIAFAAAAMTGTAFICFGQVPHMPTVLFVFAGTFATYNYHRVVQLARRTGGNDIFIWLRSHRKKIIAATIIACLFALVMLVFFMPHSALWPVSVAALLSVSYVFPFKVPGLRRIPYLKVMIVSLTWVILCAGIPASMLPVSSELIILHSIHQFCFVFAITLPFDIRDKQFDRMDKLPTLVHLLGARSAVNLCRILMIVAAWVIFKGYLFYQVYPLEFAFPLLVHASVVLLIYNYLIALRPNTGYFLAFDGMLILQYLLLQAYLIID